LSRTRLPLCSKPFERMLRLHARAVHKIRLLICTVAR
jgi:hypothetical protein